MRFEAQLNKRTKPAVHNSYQTAKRIVTDPQHARCLSMKTVSGLTRKLQVLS